MNEVELKEKVNQWAKTIGVNPKKIKINKMNRKWASCSSQGIITFNRELLKEDIQFCEYVIVHELIHLQVPNHGILFKSLLKAYLVDNKDIQRTQYACSTT